MRGIISRRESVAAWDVHVVVCLLEDARERAEAEGLDRFAATIEHVIGQLDIGVDRYAFRCRHEDVTDPLIAAAWQRLAHDAAAQAGTALTQPYARPGARRGLI